MSKPLTSPDGKFKALQFGSFVGGGMSPYCDITFAVVSSAMSDRDAWKDAYRVAEFPCLGLKAGGIGHGVVWSGQDRLQITFDLNKSLQNGRVIIKNRDATSKIGIDYFDR